MKFLRSLNEFIKQKIKENKAPNYFYKILCNSMPKIVCIDIGASYFAHEKWFLFLKSKSSEWIIVEPNSQNLEYVKKWKWYARPKVFPVGLSEKGGKKNLYVTNVDSGSSLLEPKIPLSQAHRVKSREYFFPVKKIKIDTITLKDILAAEYQNHPVIIKLDCQGTELSILKGASQYFKNHRVVGVEIESSLLAEPIMQGSSKFNEVVSFLEGFGFELLDLNLIPGQTSKRYNRF